MINEKLLTNREVITFKLRELFSQFNYKPYSMSKFEEYDLYVNNKEFLVSDEVITFTDTNGKLMALKPDVTLSIIKNIEINDNVLTKLYYNENVYRVSDRNGSFSEILQNGIECFGDLNDDNIIEVISLAVKSLLILSNDSYLEISNIDIIENLVKNLNLSNSIEKSLYKAISDKNFDYVSVLLSDNKINDETIVNFVKLIKFNGCISDAIEFLDSNSFKNVSTQIISQFIAILKNLKSNDLNNNIKVDFSILNDINYYDGVVFKGFIKNVPSHVLSGGQYGKLMQKLNKSSKAIGFAVYTDLIDIIDLTDKSSKLYNDDYINVALPKGRLGESVYEIFEKSGFDCPSIKEKNRKLVFENPDKKIRFFWVKPSDVSVYVERGAADIGVAGKDIILEYSPNIYELLDLNIGKCNMCVAGPNDANYRDKKTLRVATKFKNIATNYYRSIGQDIDIIHLNGSIELAPLLGLSDVIVDIVETGKTLKENNLKVFENILPISARLIANKSSYRFKDKMINEITKSISKNIGV